MSGRETRTQQFANPYFDIELTYDVLRADAMLAELQAIAGFFAQAGGERRSRFGSRRRAYRRSLAK